MYYVYRILGKLIWLESELIEVGNGVGEDYGLGS